MTRLDASLDALLLLTLVLARFDALGDGPALDPRGDALLRFLADRDSLGGRRLTTLDHRRLARFDAGLRLARLSLGNLLASGGTVFDARVLLNGPPLRLRRSATLGASSRFAGGTATLRFGGVALISIPGVLGTGRSCGDRQCGDSGSKQ